MKLAHPRITVRRLMIAVFLASLVFGGIAEAMKLRVKSEEYRARATSHGVGCVGVDPEYNRYCDEWNVCNEQKKYERAARYPWLPIAPDTPEPTEPN